MLRANLVVMLFFTVVAEWFLLNFDYWIDITPNFSILNLHSGNDANLSVGPIGGARRRVVEDFQRYAILADGSIAIESKKGLCVVDIEGNKFPDAPAVSINEAILKRNNGQMPQFQTPSRFQDMTIVIMQAIVIGVWTVFLIAFAIRRGVQKRSASTQQFRFLA